MLASLADKAGWLSDGEALVLHGIVELRWLAMEFGPVGPKLGGVSAPARGCI